MTTSTSKFDLNPEEKLAVARATVRKKWPYIMSTIYGMIPRRESRFPTMFITKGMVLAYNPKYVMEMSVDEVAAALVHESQHVLRGYFDRVLRIPEAERHIYMRAADLPINSDLKDAGWQTRDEWLYPETYGFPKGKSSEEYYEMLRKLPKPPPVSMLGAGGCGSPNEMIEMELDREMDDQGNPVGRAPHERKAIIRQTMQEAKQHMEQRGRGSVPSWMQELVDIEHRPSRIPWQDRLSSIVRDVSGPIISGGGDYSIRHPSNRSYSRKMIRPGLVDQILVPLFIVDTSGSMSMKQMMAGIDESIAILTQFGIDEAYLCQVDAAVAEEPHKVNLGDLTGAIQFKGRGGTDFGPGFRAALRMMPRPDVIFYWTDGDGYAPRTPCPIPTVWGVVPHSHYTRRPAPWGHVVTITEDETHPEDEEERFAKPLTPPAGYQGWDEESAPTEDQEETDMSEYEGGDDDDAQDDDDVDDDD